MPSLDLQVSNDADDAWELNGVFMGGDNYMYLNSISPNPLYAGLRFQNVNIPQGARIDHAYLIVSQTFVINDDPETTLYAEAVDNSNVIEGGGELLSAKPLTTNSVLWSDNNVGMGWKQSPDIRDVIQEIVNRSGWSSANSLTIIAKDTQSGKKFTADDYSYLAGQNAARLHIEYTVFSNTGFRSNVNSWINYDSFPPQNEDISDKTFEVEV